MMSEPGQQAIVIHILSNIARSKDTHNVTFGQLIEYNMRNIFLEKSYINVLKKLPRPPSKVEGCQNIEAKLQATCFYLPLKPLLNKQIQVWVIPCQIIQYFWMLTSLPLYILLG